MIKGVITDIQRASINDGPGFRTTVFFKGCPLKCEWCHNPECISFEPQILHYPELCIGCGMCDRGCFSGAKVVCGKKMSVDEVINEVLLDKDYYGIKGGVTFSGGEPFAQKEFLNSAIDECKKNDIHCAVETSMIYFDDVIFKKLDLVMADLKIWSDDLHIKYTGVSNKDIKKHFEMLNMLGVPIIARTPIISEINQGVDKISEFLKELKNVVKYELLPYHPLGESKRIALGEKVNQFKIPSKQYMEAVNRLAFTRGT